MGWMQTGEQQHTHVSRSDLKGAQQQQNQGLDSQLICTREKSLLVLGEFSKQFTVINQVITSCASEGCWKLLFSALSLADRMPLNTMQNIAQI